jgi:very-short-patch-repair endonuclease
MTSSSPLNRGTGIDTKPKVPLVRGQAEGLGVASGEVISQTKNLADFEKTPITPKPSVSPLNRGTRKDTKPKVPLVRGQAEGLGVAEVNKQADISQAITPFHQITYNPKLVDRSKKMSREMTKAERKIWFELLSNKQLLGYKFIKQKITFNYILDFYCSELMLAIEVDGESHDRKIEYDKVRDDFLKASGIKVLRFRNDEVLVNLEGVRRVLVECIDKKINVQ